MCDMLFYLQFVASGFGFFTGITWDVNCQWLAFWSEFFQLAADMYFLALCIDLRVCLFNPFTNYKLNTRVYHGCALSVACVAWRAGVLCTGWLRYVGGGRRTRVMLSLVAAGARACLLLPPLPPASVLCCGVAGCGVGAQCHHGPVSGDAALRGRAHLRLAELPDGVLDPELQPGQAEREPVHVGPLLRAAHHHLPSLHRLPPLRALPHTGRRAHHRSHAPQGLSQHAAVRARVGRAAGLAQGCVLVRACTAHTGSANAAAPRPVCRYVVGLGPYWTLAAAILFAIQVDRHHDSLRIVFAVIFGCRDLVVLCVWLWTNDMAEAARLRRLDAGDTVTSAWLRGVAVRQGVY